MHVLDLFSGIGGFSLGLERAGMTTAAFCEIDPYCRDVLRKHWPGVPIYDDIRGLTADTLRRDGIAVDLICGGFPCRDISVAGKGAGLAGERSGLWSEYRRLISECGPEWIIIENVPAILSRGADTVLNDLAALGYDALWECISAGAVGAPHRRDRWWCVAHATGIPERKPADKTHSIPASRKPRDESCDSGKSNVCDTDSTRLEVRESIGGNNGQEFQTSLRADWWAVEPNVGRVADGVSARVDRLRGLGNAVVPQVVELIGREIMAVTT